jgi:hypothetical protein
MDSSYNELKGVSEMPGSLNTVISSAYRSKRAYAFSESFAHTPENIERVKYNSNTNLSALLDIEPTAPVVLPSFPILPVLPIHASIETNESIFVNIVIRFVFHIALISVFESVFFFLYISKLEDSGIISTVNSVIANVVNSCMYFTPAEDAIVSDVLSLFVNTTNIVKDANNQYSMRTAFNHTLLLRAWVYVGGLGGLFLLLILYVYARNIKVHWGKLVLENIGLVLMLATYEYMFFSTIIFPYMPITGSEITRNAIQNLQATCGIL